MIKYKSQKLQLIIKMRFFDKISDVGDCWHVRSKADHSWMCVFS